MANIALVEFYNIFKPTSNIKSYKEYIDLVKPLAVEKYGSSEGTKKPEGLGAPDLLVVEIEEDIDLNIKNSFGTGEDFLPRSAKGILDLAKSVQGLSGSRGGVTSILNTFDMPVWTETEGFKVKLSATFYTDDNPLFNVIVPTYGIISICSLSPVFDKDTNRLVGIAVPGVNFGNLGIALDKATDKDRETAAQENRNKVNDPNVKLISLNIPGVIYLPSAYIPELRVTFSNQMTEYNIPLWTKLEMEVNGFRPANTFDLVQSLIRLDRINPREPSGKDADAQNKGVGSIAG